MDSEIDLDSIIFYVFIFSSMHFAVGYKLFNNKSYILTSDVFSCTLTSLDKCCLLKLPVNSVWLFYL